MAEKYSQWEKEQIKDFQKRFTTNLYCQLCGREILPYGGELDKYEFEAREEAHTECIRRYQAEKNEKARQELESKSTSTE
jgi:hypothetical protein